MQPSSAFSSSASDTAGVTLAAAPCGEVGAATSLEEKSTTVLQLQAEFPKVWAIVSSRDGSELLPKSLLSYLRSVGLESAAKAPIDDAVRTLLTYLRGDGGGLEVRSSQIPGAGQGLFAARSFAAGELLCVYSGTPVPLAQVARKEVSTDYLMGGFGIWSIDASGHPEVLARYINDHPGPDRCNVRFVKLKAQRRALVVALRNITPGEELFVHYGEGYWRARPGSMQASDAGAEASSGEGVQCLDWPDSPYDYSVAACAQSATPAWGAQ